MANKNTTKNRDKEKSLNRAYKKQQKVVEEIYGSIDKESISRKGTNKNLITFADLTPEQRSAVSRAGGLAKARKHQTEVILSDVAKELCSLPLCEDDEIRSVLKKRGFADDKMNEYVAVTYSLIQRARNDTKSFEVLRDTMGQKPAEKQINLNVSRTQNADDIINRHFDFEDIEIIDIEDDSDQD